MKRELIYAAVIGGVVGALMTAALGLVLPMGAQTQVTDAEFGTITCRKLLVKYEYDDAVGTEMSASEIWIRPEAGAERGTGMLLQAEHMGLYGGDWEDGAPQITMDIDKHYDHRPGGAQIKMTQGGPITTPRLLVLNVGEDGASVRLEGMGDGRIGLVRITNEGGVRVWDSDYRRWRRD